MAPMAIIDPKERALRPFFMRSMLRFSDIQDYRNSIFIVIPDEALVSIRGISPHNSIPFHGAFCGFVVGDDDSSAGLEN